MREHVAAFLRTENILCTTSYAFRGNRDVCRTVLFRRLFMTIKAVAAMCKTLFPRELQTQLLINNTVPRCRVVDVNTFATALQSVTTEL